jgi:hypothetical protein
MAAHGPAVQYAPAVLAYERAEIVCFELGGLWQSRLACTLSSLGVCGHVPGDQRGWVLVSVLQPLSEDVQASIHLILSYNY